jgi:hypothetical protein
MALSDIAPRLGRAHADMKEAERVLGWLRDHSWTGGIYVLVPVRCYLGLLHDRNKPQWVYVDRVVQGDAAPYPIRGHMHGSDYERTFRIDGQWAFWEVEGIRFLSDDYPELLDKHPEFPRPRHLEVDPSHA